MARTFTISLTRVVRDPMGCDHCRTGAGSDRVRVVLVRGAEVARLGPTTAGLTGARHLSIGLAVVAKVLRVAAGSGGRARRAAGVVDTDTAER
ncbi:hypothetical protein C5E45_20065 [Nocardia nova]|uniref:Uncharacterized protein n=1 Tax=Nocardia nova TaxID=37330 RepID=A0A2S6AM97_9NOCA|nr:hypothetical protein C5E45_20065 [Nocardia nova]